MSCGGKTNGKVSAAKFTSKIKLSCQKISPVILAFLSAREKPPSKVAWLSFMLNEVKILSKLFAFWLNFNLALSSVIPPLMSGLFSVPLTLISAVILPCRLTTAAIID